MRQLSHYLLLATALFLVSCGPDQASTTDASSVRVQPQPTKTLTLTTFRLTQAEREIIDAFEQENVAEVIVNQMSAGEIVLAAQAGQLTGDIIITPTLEDIIRLKNFGQLQPFYVDAFSKGNVDDSYMDNEGYYAGLTRWTMCAVYDPKAVAVGEVTSYKGLAQLANRGIKVGMAHPDSSGLAGVISGLATVVNPQAATLWTNVMYNGLAEPPGGSDWNKMDQLLLGQLQVAFVSSGTAVRWFLNGDPSHFEAGKRLRVKFPRTETDNVNFFNMTSIGMRANVSNRDLAMRFINHMYQKENQEKLAEAIFEYPSEAFSEIDSYLLGLPDALGRRVSANTIEDQIPLAWEIINRIGSRQ